MRIRVGSIHFFSPTTNSSQFDIVVNVAPMGPGSQYFLSCRVGDTVEIIAPLGMFCLTDSPNKKVFVATGTGIAPFYSMIVDSLSLIPYLQSLFTGACGMKKICLARTIGCTANPLS